MKGVIKITSCAICILAVFCVNSFGAVHAGRIAENFDHNMGNSTLSSPEFDISLINSNSIIVSPGESIQTAIDSASAGDVIWVESGDFEGSLSFGGKDITVRSIAGPQHTKIISDFTSTIDIGPGGTLLDFTITGSLNLDYAAIEVHGDGTLIKGNIIEDSPRNGIGRQVGIWGNTSSPTIANNVFRDNTCDEQHLSAVVVFVNNSSPRIINNIFYDNQCTAINMTQPTGTQPEVINNTIFGNRAGIVVDARVNPILQVYRNNIVVNNDHGLVINARYADNSPTWENNLVFGNDNNYIDIADQTGISGNISTDPMFRDSDNHDFHLKSGSQAIDSGSISNAPSYDFDGFPRPSDGDNNGTELIDMGAFEKGYRAQKLVQGSFEPGGNISYSITLESVIESSSATVSFEDAINQSLSYIPGSLSASNGLAEEQNGIIMWTGSVDSTSPTTISYDALISEETPRGTTITNTASINWNGTNLDRRSNFYLPFAHSYLPCISREYCPLGLHDDFSNPNSGWPIDEDNYVVFNYVDGEYRIVAKQANMWAAVRKDSKSNNFQTGVDVRSVSSTYGTYGLMFNIAEDWSHFYSFEIDRDGYFGIWRYSDAAGWKLLYVNHSPYINTGNFVNQLGVRRDGALIEVFANNHKLAAISDGSFIGQHDVGMIATTFNESYLDVRFDNYYITPSECTGTSTLSAAEINSSGQADQRFMFQDATKTLH